MQEYLGFLLPDFDWDEFVETLIRNIKSNFFFFMER